MSQIVSTKVLCPYCDRKVMADERTGSCPYCGGYVTDKALVVVGVPDLPAAVGRIKASGFTDKKKLRREGKELYELAKAHEGKMTRRVLESYMVTLGYNAYTIHYRRLIVDEALRLHTEATREDMNKRRLEKQFKDQVAVVDKVYTSYTWGNDPALDDVIVEDSAYDEGMTRFARMKATSLFSAPWDDNEININKYIMVNFTIMAVVMMGVMTSMLYMADDPFMGVLYMMLFISGGLFTKYLLKDYVSVN